MRRIGVVTVARSDYGIYLPLLRAIRDDRDCELCLIAAGMHLAPEFGATEHLLISDGFPPAARVEMLLSSDSAEGIAKSMGVGTIGFAQALTALEPDLLVVLGDRFEMHAAAAAAVPFTIPLAHIHGGELTYGAFDDQFRHSITKLSHLHFVATDVYRRRVIQMGEEPWRVHTSGALGIDNIVRTPPLSRGELARRFGVPAEGPFLLVTFHPVTLEVEDAPAQLEQLLTALATAGCDIVFTMPNADPAGRALDAALQAFVDANERAHMVRNFGTEGYLSAMHHADAMVGNSSSGIIEAASFALPVVNIGTRQDGRLRAPNVLDTGYAADDIQDAIATARSDAFRTRLHGMTNPYGDGGAAERILTVLKSTPLDERLRRKRFVDSEGAADEVVVSTAPSAEER